MKQYRDFIAKVGEHKLDDSEALFEMANLFSKHTGLPFVVWISYRGALSTMFESKSRPAPRRFPQRWRR